MSGEGGDRRQHPRVPVAARRITLQLPETHGNGREVSARLLDLSRVAMSGSAPLAGVSPGTRVKIEVDAPWWRFGQRLSVPGVVRRISDDGSRWAIQFLVEDEGTRKRLDNFVGRAYKAFEQLLKEGAGAKLAESLRRVELGFGPAHGEGSRVILITSAVADDGKASVAAGLAIVLAQEGRRVLLVEADAGSSSIVGPAARSKGLLDVLGADAGTEALKPLSVPIWRNVDLLPIGSSQDAGTAPTTQELEHLVRHLRTNRAYHYAVVNAPPLLRSAGTASLAASVDDVFVVARTVVSKERDLIQVRDLLARSHAPFRGIILTDEADESPDSRRRGSTLSKLAFRKRAAPTVETYAGEERWDPSGAGK